MHKRVTDPAQFGRVAVLMGGWSSERQVSLWSGDAVLQALLRQGVDATGIDVDRHNVLGLAAAGFARAFIVVHGSGGEDGILQAALELQGLAYTGSGVGASAIKMDKVTAKRIWKAEGLPTADFAVLADEDDARTAASRFGYPFVIKPSAEGSSVGVSIVKSAAQLGEALGIARGAGRAVMAERFVKGAEITVAVLDGAALPSVRIVPAGEFYDFHAKYVAEDTQYHCPSGLDRSQEQALGALALRAFELIGAHGWGRVDFIVDQTGQPWILEINTVPGMTSHSLVPMAARAHGLDFDALCWAILETSLTRGTGNQDGGTQNVAVAGRPFEGETL